MTYIQLTYSDLILPALLVVMDGALSLALQLKLERQLAIATVRMDAGPLQIQEACKAMPRDVSSACKV